MTEPMVSIICPTYNHEPYLRQALDSILMQKMKFPFEVLIGEDCSPDRSRAILQEYEAKYPNFFTMLYRKKNIGAMRNVHDLIMQAQGKYLATLELDDYWTNPYKLQKQVDFLEAHPEYIGCAHNFSQINETGEIVIAQALDSTLVESKFTLQDFLTKGFVFQSATCVIRNIYKDGGDYSILYKAHPLVGDITSHSITLSRGDFYIMPDNMSVYRRVIKPGGTSAASYATEHRAESLIATMRQLVMLDKYFNGEIDYSPRMIYPVETYLSEWLRRKGGFTTRGMRYMWANATKSVKMDVCRFVMGFPIRWLRRRKVNG